MRTYMLFWALFVLAVASEIKFAQTAPDCTRISTVVKTQDDVSRLTNCIKALQDGRGSVAQTAPESTSIIIKTQDDVERFANCIQALQDGRYGKRSSYDNFDNNVRYSPGNSYFMEENSNSNQDLLQEFYDYLRKINA